MCRMAVGASNVVAPMLTAAEVVVSFFARVTAETRLRYFFRRLRFERDNLLRVAFLHMRLAGSMTRLATRHLSFPTVVRGESGVRCMREGLELVFVTVFASIAADVIV